MICASCQHPGANTRQSSDARGDDAKAGLFLLSNFEGVSYFFEATRAEIRRTPEWKGSVEFPPLPPRRAEAAALLVVRKLRPDVQKWSRESISLKQISGGRWMYVVRFWRGDVGLAGVPYYLNVPVLMDGHAIEGTLKPKHVSTTEGAPELTKDGHPINKTPTERMR
jgi:hypothetical protein